MTPCGMSVYAPFAINNYSINSMTTQRLQNFFQVIHSRQNRILIFCVLAGILIISLSKLPFLWAPYGHDQENYLYLGREILHGAVPYRDLFDHKFPGLPIINALVWTLGINSPVPFRVVEYGWTIAVFIAFVLLLRVLLKDKQLTIGLGSIFFALLLGHFYFSTGDGGGYTEEYFLLPNIAAIILLLRYDRLRKNSLLLWVGLLIFFSFFIKQVGLFLFFPATIFVISIWYKTFSSWKQSIRPTMTALSLMALGFIIPISLFFLYLYFHGALPYFYDEMFRFNKLYSERNTFWNKTFTSIFTLHRYAVDHPVTYFLVALGMCRFIFRPSKYSFLFLPWLVSDIVAIGTAGWFFNHYYIQLFPILGILASYGILLLIQATTVVIRQHRQILLLSTFPLFLLIFIPYFSTPTINYVDRWRALQITTVPGSWQKLAPDLIGYVKERTKPGDYIYVWDSAQVYVYLETQTVSSSRYYTGVPFAEMHAIGYVTPKHWEQYKNDLKEHPPKVILINEAIYSGIKKNDSVWNYIQNDYQYDTTIVSPNGPTELYLPKKNI